MAQSIAITGQGIICAIGADCAAVLASLQRGEKGIAGVQHLTTTHNELPVGEVKMSNSEIKEALGIAPEKEVSRTSLLGAIALKQALNSSSLTSDDLSQKRVALISGTTVGGMDVTERHYSKMHSDANIASYLKQHDCGSNTKEIADICGIDARFITISTACSSALNAIIIGTRLLLANKVDIVIAGGSEALSRFHLNGFNSLMILDHEDCRPFDNSRQGLNLGEGAAYVILEKEKDFKVRKNEAPLGYIAGYGNRCDAFHQTATSENGEGAFLAMSDALSMSGLAIDKIDYINAHGTGTPDNDRSESQAIIRIFSESYPPVSSTKSFTGHTTSASGSIETVICLLSMHHNLIPANLRWSDQSPQCITPSAGINEIKLRNVICNSFGFGGNDSSIIISKEPILLGEISEMGQYTLTPVEEITNTDDLSESKKYIQPIEARRMSKLMKAAIITSKKALENAGIEKPDAIVIGTAFGMLDQGEKILNHLTTQGEEGLSPTLFMQSTHNTIAGSLATRFKCHGYNITYSQGSDSWEIAIEDAKQLIAEGKAKNVLVGVHDYCPPHFRNIYELAGEKIPFEIMSRSLVISKTSSGRRKISDE